MRGDPRTHMGVDAMINEVCRAPRTLGREGQRIRTLLITSPHRRQHRHRDKVETPVLS